MFKQTLVFTEPSTHSIVAYIDQTATRAHQSFRSAIETVSRCFFFENLALTLSMSA